MKGCSKMFLALVSGTVTTVPAPIKDTVSIQKNIFWTYILWHILIKTIHSRIVKNRQNLEKALISSQFNGCGCYSRAFFIVATMVYSEIPIKRTFLLNVLFEIFHKIFNSPLTD